MKLIDLYIDALNLQKKQDDEDRQIIRQLPVGQRVEKGYTIAGARIEAAFYPDPPTEYCGPLSEGMGYIMSVKVRCGNNLSKFRAGSSVLLHWKELQFQMEVVKDSVTEFVLAPNKFNVADCVMDMSHYPRYGWQVDMLDNDATYNLLMATAGYLEQDRACAERIEDILEGKSPTETGSWNELPPDNGLNPTQNQAVARSLVCRDFHLIQGPPGTGKTHTIGVLGAHLLERGANVLVSGPTHTAINNCLNKIAEVCGDSRKVVKVGEKYQSDELVGPESVTRKTRLPKATYLRDSQLSREGIVAGATPYALCYPASKKLDGWTFDYAVVDEAAQMSIPMAVAIMSRCRTVIWVGDHRQLNPIVPRGTENPLLAKSIFKHLADLYPERLTLLEESYRLCPALLELPNNLFYGGLLKSDVPQSKPYVGFRYHSQYQAPLKMEAADILMLHDEFDGMEHSPYEAGVVSEMVGELINNGVPISEIGILTPYRAQVREIRHTLWEKGILDERQVEEVFVDTVERLQGQERQYVFYSMANPNPMEDESALQHPDEVGRLEFLYSANRLNVALTRAKIKCVVVANRQVFETAELLAVHPESTQELKEGSQAYARYRQLADTYEQDPMDESDVWL